MFADGLIIFCPHWGINFNDENLRDIRSTKILKLGTTIRKYQVDFQKASSIEQEVENAQPENIYGMRWKENEL